MHINFISSSLSLILGLTINKFLSKKLPTNNNQQNNANTNQQNNNSNVPTANSNAVQAVLNLAYSKQGCP
ncbi:C40 family peptidase, partial [Clostridioides difficile]